MIPRETKSGRTGVLALLALLWAPAAFAQPTPQYEVAGDLAVALRRLGPTQRVLMIGAHPDDENTAVIAQLAIGAGADVAYLSLTRGEGGQNLIGPELQEGLGLIRSEELLAARRLDGARQFFTRAYDYGFSKSADEAFSQWPRDSLLADVVAVVRQFRPDVLIAIFSGTPADGHGQHMASGILARDVFTAAGDPARFPGQIAAGLAPHRPGYLYQALWRGMDPNAIELQTGEYDPVLGRSRYQLAMESRSRHRSQDMGQAQPPGPHSTPLAPVAGDPPAGAASPFAGLDTTLVQRAGDGAARAALEEYEAAVARAKKAFNPLAPDRLVEPLADAVDALDRALGKVDDDGDLRFHLRNEREQAARALRIAAGVTLDVTADRRQIVPGGTFELTLTVWNGGDRPVRITDLGPRPPDAWPFLVPYDNGNGGPIDLQPGELVERTVTVRVPADAQPTEPYFLERPRDGALYTWPDDVAVRTLPFEPDPIRGGAAVQIEGTTIPVDAPATFVEVDKSFGELRLPVFVVPAVSVRVAPRVTVVPIGAADDGSAREIVVTLDAAAPADGTLSVEAPAGWQVEPASSPVAFEAAGERQIVRFTIAPPPDPAPGEVRLEARFTDGQGRSFAEGYELIAYPHTRPRTLYESATVRVAAFPVTIAEGLRIGYIEGAGDDGALALRQMGARLELVDATMLARGDLSRFDVLVAGIRAYEVRPDLVENNARVLDWVRNGGTFVVNYNKYELVEGSFAPWPLTMARPHGRVTDENAPVTLLEPDHPLLAWPNRIGAADFNGWVQERGLYFADTWDDRYTPLLAMSDPGEEPLHGSLLVTRVGEGTWIYTGLALFRQWPEAVPGAYRLLANMVSIGRAPR